MQNPNNPHMTKLQSNKQNQSIKYVSSSPISRLETGHIVSPPHRMNVYNNLYRNGNGNGDYINFGGLKKQGGELERNSYDYDRGYQNSLDRHASPKQYTQCTRNRIQTQASNPQTYCHSHTHTNTHTNPRPTKTSNIYTEYTESIKTTQQILLLLKRNQHHQKIKTQQFIELSKQIKDKNELIDKCVSQYTGNIGKVLLELQEFNNQVVSRCHWKGFGHGGFGNGGLIGGSCVGSGGSGNANQTGSGSGSCINSKDNQNFTIIQQNQKQSSHNNNSNSLKYTIISKLLQSQQDPQHEPSISSILHTLKSQKITPNFTPISELLTSTHNSTKTDLSLLQTKFQTSKTQVSKQQKQSQESLLKLVNIQNKYIQQLELELLENDRVSQEKFGNIQDRIQIVKGEIQDKFVRCCQERKREDRYIQQIVEKMIYKMSLL